MNKYIRNLLYLTIPLSIFIILLLYLTNAQKRSIKILFAGDMMLDRGTRKVIEKRGIDYLFEDIHNLFKDQDIIVVNLEGTVCDTGLTPTPKAYNFMIDKAWLTSFSSHKITHVCLANNHSIDFGKEGLQQTYNYLIQNKVTPIGYHHHQNPCEPIIIKRNGIQLAMFSSSFLYEKEESCICHESGKELAERIRLFKIHHPGVHIVLCLHWGIEMSPTPEKEQQAQAHAFIDAGADLIIGHHPHVVQTIEQYKGKWIFYSLGNFIFDTNNILSNRGIFTCFSVSKDHIELTETIPFFIRNSKPFLMNKKDADHFFNKLNSTSAAFIE